VTAHDITAADLTARQMRFKVEAQTAADGRLLTFDMYMSAEELSDE
jgi:hypothetical protein